MILLFLLLSCCGINAELLPDFCVSSMEEHLNITSFPVSVAHGIHSLTVEDVRIFFDPGAEQNIRIPTINQNLSGSVLLQYLPFANYDEEFMSIALKSFGMLVIF